jgi:ketosteroid isomerase-like protein
MSAEELVTEAWSRWNAGERTADPELFTEDVEIHSALTKTVWRGISGVEAWATEIDDQFERWEVTIEEMASTTGDQVAARGWIKARGRGSGLDLDQPASWLVVVRDGKIASIRNFIGYEGARKAAAQLEEEEDP